MAALASELESQGWHLSEVTLMMLMVVMMMIKAKAGTS